MSRIQFTYMGGFEGQIYPLARFTYDPETTTIEDVYAGIAEGFRRLAEDFDFAAIQKGFDNDGTEPSPG